MLNPYSTIAVIVALVELFYKEHFQDLGFWVWGLRRIPTPSL